MQKYSFSVIIMMIFMGCSAPQMEMAYDSSREPIEYQYKVAFADKIPDLTDWFSPSWKNAETGSVANFYFLPGKKTRYLPETKFKLMYGRQGLYIIFLVHDMYVLARNPMRGMVCRDSCVEFFFQIPAKNEYFNLEMAAGGNFLIYYITDITCKNYINLPQEDYAQIKTFPSIRGGTFEEKKQPESWTLGAFIPFTLLSKYHGTIINSSTVKGQVWRGNFYKCANGSNVHWASWAKLPEVKFHLPEYFGYLNFE